MFILLLKKRFFLLVSIFLHTPGLFAVVNGNLANNAKFKAVGSIKVGNVESVSCTATLINSKWIVTADHCIHATEESEEEGSGELLPASEYEFRLGHDFHSPIFQIKLKRWVSAPTLNGETIDIAFGELVEEVPIKKLNIFPIKMISQQWTSLDLDSSYIHIGYGMHAPFSDSPEFDGKRQQANLKVTHTEGNALLKIFSNESNLENYIERFHPQSIESASLDAIISNGELLQQYSVHAWDPRGRSDVNNIVIPEPGWQDTCFGDSGGPLLIEIENQLYVVGVVSQGMDRICSSYGTKFTILGPKVTEIINELGI